MPERLEKHYLSTFEDTFWRKKMRWEKQLATEADLSYCAVEGALEQLREGSEDSTARLRIRSEDWQLAAMMHHEGHFGLWDTWKVDLELPRDAWFVENDTHRVWGSRGD